MHGNFLFSALHLIDKLVACCRLLRCQQSSSPLLAVCPSWGQFHLTPIMTFKTCPQGRRGEREGGAMWEASDTIHCPCFYFWTHFAAFWQTVFTELRQLHYDAQKYISLHIFSFFKWLLISCRIGSFGAFGDME